MEQSKEKQDINNINEQGILNELILLYKIQGHEKNIRLFGDTFFENNQNNFSLFINDKEVQFCDIISKNQIEGNSNIIKVILKEKDMLTIIHIYFLNVILYILLQMLIK